MADTFWVVWCEKGGTPTVRHLTEESARAEAVRLAKKLTGATVHVLALVDSVTAEARVMWASHAPECLLEQPCPAIRPSHPGVLADEERVARGWSVEELARKLDWSWHCVTRWLQGKEYAMAERDYADLSRVFIPTTSDFWRRLYQNWCDWVPEKRECATCRHFHDDFTQEPCRMCHDPEHGSKWQPKVTP